VVMDSSQEKGAEVICDELWKMIIHDREATPRQLNNWCRLLICCYSTKPTGRNDGNNG